MKNGEPSLFFDIRYYLRTDPAHRKTIYELEAYGRRLAWLLNAGGLSLGAYNTLTFLTDEQTPEPRLGEVGIGESWWFRDVYFGSYLDLKDEREFFRVCRDDTLSALKQLCPEKTDEIDRADNRAMTLGERLRFIVRRKDYSKFKLELATTIATHPSESQYYALLTEISSGDVVEVGPIQTGIYLLAKEELARVGIRDFRVSRDASGDLCATSSLGQVKAKGRTSDTNEDLYVRMVTNGPA